MIYPVIKLEGIRHLCRMATLPVCVPVNIAEYRKHSNRKTCSETGHSVSYPLSPPQHPLIPHPYRHLLAVKMLQQRDQELA